MKIQNLIPDLIRDRKICKPCPLIILLFFLIFPILIISTITYAEWTVQVGVFEIKQNAENLKVELQDRGFSAEVIELGDGFARVWVGRFNTRGEAFQFSQIIKRRGYPVWIKEIGKEKGKEKVKKSLPENPPPKEKEEKINWKKVTALEIASYKDKNKGKRLRNELNKKGYFAYLLMEIKGKDVYYKVVVPKQENETLKETAERLKKDGYNFKTMK